MTRKGRAKAFHHNSLASIMWLRFAELEVEVRVERVPSEENIADLPSREYYGLLERMGAQMVLIDFFCMAEAEKKASGNPILVVVDEYTGEKMNLQEKGRHVHGEALGP